MRCVMGPSSGHASAPRVRSPRRRGEPKRFASTPPDDQGSLPMPESLLAGVRVLDLAQEPAAMTGRIFADLGADVVVVETPDGHPLRRFPNRFLAWAAGKRAVTVDGPDDPALDALLAGADVVIDTPGYPGAWELDPDRAPQAVWVSVTPFGRAGPRSG